MSLRCVVLDIDDTLYLERDYVQSGFRAVGTYLAGQNPTSNLAENFSQKAWQCFLDGVRANTFNRVLAEIGVVESAELISAMLATYRDHLPTISLCDDVPEFLREISVACTLGCVTDGATRSQRQKIAALGLGDWIRHIVVTDEFGRDRWKPHPHGFMVIETLSRFRGDECVYVADNPHKDFVSPKQLGWHTVRIRRPNSLHAAVPSLDDVDVEFDSLLPALPHLESLL